MLLPLNLMSLVTKVVTTALNGIRINIIGII